MTIAPLIQTGTHRDRLDLPQVRDALQVGHARPRLSVHLRLGTYGVADVKYRCLVEPTYVTVEADNRYDAQLLAFAKTVRDLSPSDFVVWETGPKDEWAEEEKHGA
jgi:hypothetical protein